MKILIIVSLSMLLLLVIIILALVLMFKYAKLIAKNTRLTKYFYNYLNIITSARYGNLNVKADDGVDAFTIQLSRNTNALLESIKDRDSMINEYIEKEKQSQNLKQDFISSLAHDLKVPIIAQDNTYDLLLNGSFGEINEEQKNAIKNLKISNNDLKNLVLDILDAQKIDTQELILNKESTDINKLIIETLEQNKSILTIKNKIIDYQKIDDISLSIDPFLIKRVLNNLISNAIFYGKNTKNIYINLKKTAKNLHISITDEGSGIKENEIKNIFKKYYSSAKKYSNVGVGLGLYIANKIILAHGGKIQAKNTKDKGACFDISLPLK